MIEIRDISEIRPGDKIVVPFGRQIEGMTWLPIMTVKEVGDTEILLNEVPYDFYPEDPSEIMVWDE